MQSSMHLTRSPLGRTMGVGAFCSTSNTSSLQQVAQRGTCAVNAAGMAGEIRKRERHHQHSCAGTGGDVESNPCIMVTRHCTPRPGSWMGGCLLLVVMASCVLVGGGREGGREGGWVGGREGGRSASPGGCGWH
jgi:hypothetical protein